MLWVLCGKNRKWDFVVKLVTELVFFCGDSVKTEDERDKRRRKVDDSYVS